MTDSEYHAGPDVMVQLPPVDSQVPVNPVLQVPGKAMDMGEARGSNQRRASNLHPGISLDALLQH